jgi:hypothetical protein
VSRPFERWTVLARTGGTEGPIRFADLGLAADREFMVFEFWTRQMLGAFRELFVPGPVDSRYQVQDFCIRERLDHPQLLATSRHVGCGVVDLVDVAWSGDTLRGSSDVVGGDAYELYLTEPAGFRFAGATADGAEVLGSERSGELRVVRLNAGHSARVTWRVRWTRER